MNDALACALVSPLTGYAGMAPVCPSKAGIESRPCKVASGVHPEAVRVTVNDRPGRRIAESVGDNGGMTPLR